MNAQTEPDPTDTPDEERFPWVDNLQARRIWTIEVRPPLGELTQPQLTPTGSSPRTPSRSSRPRARRLR